MPNTDMTALCTKHCTGYAGRQMKRASSQIACVQVDWPLMNVTAVQRLGSRQLIPQ